MDNFVVAGTYEKYIAMVAVGCHCYLTKKIKGKLKWDKVYLSKDTVSRMSIANRGEGQSDGRRKCLVVIQFKDNRRSLVQCSGDYLLSLQKSVCRPSPAPRRHSKRPWIISGIAVLIFFIIAAGASSGKPSSRDNKQNLETAVESACQDAKYYINLGWDSIYGIIDYADSKYISDFFGGIKILRWNARDEEGQKIPMTCYAKVSDDGVELLWLYAFILGDDITIAGSDSFLTSGSAVSE